MPTRTVSKCSAIVQTSLNLSFVSGYVYEFQGLGTKSKLRGKFTPFNVSLRLKFTEVY